MIAKCRKGMTILRDVLARRSALREATEGSVATEYSLIAALIVIAIIVTLSQVRTGLLNLPFPALIAAFTEALS